MRKRSFFDRLSDDDNVARKIDIFFVQVAAIAERESVGNEKASIGADNGEARCCLYAVVNRLSLEIATKTLEANLLRIAPH